MFKKPVIQDLCSFSIQHIDTGNIGGYILGVLHKKFEHCHIGYRCENIEGEMRCTLFTLYPASGMLKHYFQDRCSAMIEEEVKQAEPMPHDFVKWANKFKEFEEVCPYNHKNMGCYTK